MGTQCFFVNQRQYSTLTHIQVLWIASRIRIIGCILSALQRTALDRLGVHFVLLSRNIVARRNLVRDTLKV